MVTLGVAIAFSSCENGDGPVISKPVNKVGESVKPGDVSGNVKGTMTTGDTYTLKGIVTVNASDTLLIQPGVRINVTEGAALDVKGTFLSLGTKEKPIWITDPNAVKKDSPTQDLDTDPAYKGIWRGIFCYPSSPLCVIKWTHIEFVGATLASHPDNNVGPVALLFGNPDGYLVFEDNWIYGCAVDGLRMTAGYGNIMCNTIEKEGFVGGDGIYMTGSAKGNVAYNLVIGHSTTSCKVNGAGATSYACDVATYNNTSVNGGYRRTASGRGGSINYEADAMGLVYNNLTVNCKYGVRMVNNPAPDMDNIKLGNNYHYGDLESICEQFYPVGYITPHQSTDIPAPSSFLRDDYTAGTAYEASSLVGKNNPQFVNYPLPIAGLDVDNIKLLAYAGSYDFRLKSTSPAVGKGATDFKPYFLDDPKFPKGEYGSSEITLPSSDIGAFPMNNKGNQHYPGN